jgi:hypothetical protein
MLLRVTLKAEERIVVKLSKDGNIEASEVKGELKMMITDVESSYTVRPIPCRLCTRVPCRLCTRVPCRLCTRVPCRLCTRVPCRLCTRVVCTRVVCVHVSHPLSSVYHVYHICVRGSCAPCICDLAYFSHMYTCMHVHMVCAFVGSVC